MNSLNEITWSAFAIEFLVYGLFIIGIRSAWKHVPRVASAMIAFAVFAFVQGFLFERLPPSKVEMMDYGQFLIMLPGDIPLWIVLAWGVMMGSAMRTSELLGGPLWGRSLVDGALVASLSLTLDPTAVALNWYTWEHPGGYFGVPYDHALLYCGSGVILSALVRWSWQLGGPGSKVSSNGTVALGLACLFSVPLVVLYSEVLGFLYTVIGGGAPPESPPYTGQALVFLLVNGVIVALLFRLARYVSFTAPLCWPILAVPASVCILCVVLSLSEGIKTADPSILITLLAVGLITFFGWSAPSLRALLDAPSSGP